MRFNPRAREGRDFSWSSLGRCGNSFNPRAREGRDPRARQGAGQRRMVSIHAPARGATRPTMSNPAHIIKVSIHAPARGATSTTWTDLGFLPVSIHAPARGATNAIKRAQLARHVSIHAPARGATFHFFSCFYKFMFQSTRPRGARQYRGRKAASIVIVSIHAPARGATGHLKYFDWRSQVSIHAPARGATRAEAKWWW